MQVLVLTPYPYGTTAGPRSSFELWEPLLLDAGISLEYAVFETERLHEIIYQPVGLHRKAYEMARAYVEFLPKARAAKHYDAVLINREATLIGPAVVERWVASFGKPLIYHIDDPLYVPYRSPSNGLLSYLKCFGKVKSLCAMSAAVIANSPSHVSYTQQFNDNVWEIPSVVDGTVYDGWRAKPQNGGPVCVGWSGSPSTAPNLQLIREPLRALSNEPEIVLRFIGAPEFDLPDVPHTAVAWDAASEVDEIRKLDIGLVPLPFSPWAPHKFYMKLVQYMALGIPAVATPFGSNPIVIEDGRTGFLASTPGQWRQRIELLARDADLRQEFGRRAADVAHERYTLQANADKVVAAFRSVLT